MPEPATHCGQAVIGSTIWLAGGYLGDYPGASTTHVWEFNTLTNTWTPGPSLSNSFGFGGHNGCLVLAPPS